MTICLLFSITPSITAMSSQVQYIFMSCGIWSLSSGHALLICSLSCCTCSCCEVVCCSSCTDVQSQMFVVVCMASIFTYMQHISALLFSLWFYPDSQSAMNRSGPELYMILTLAYSKYIFCSLYVSDSTSFLKIATSVLWSMIILTSLAKQKWWNFLSLYSLPNSSFSMLLYLFLCLTGSCLQKQWVWVCCCLVLYLTGSVYHFM